MVSAGQEAATLASAAWQAVGKSVRGSHHRRQGVPAQDAIAWYAFPDGVALAVADGHGGASSFRSHLGAQFAVSEATALLADYAQRHRLAGSVPELAHEAAEALARELVERWRSRVRAHMEAQPFTPPLDEPARWLSYGTTVLAALAVPDWLLYLQLGDGDILLVSEQGKVRRPWPPDARLLGGETTSLCLPEAWREMRIEVCAAAGAPALLVLSTDGYANSFRKDKGFLRVGRDLLELIRAQGMAPLEAELEGWLQEASELGSGDDITVGLLCRTLPAPAAAAAPRPEPSGVG